MKVRLQSLNAWNAEEAYLPDRIREWGFADGEDFNENAVAMVFRVDTETQSFPLRVWIRKDAVAEDEWIRAGRRELEKLLGNSDAPTS